MTLRLYAHPFSSYCQKVLIALYESETPFEWCLLAPDNPSAGEELAALWPLKRMPMLRDGERTLVEASIVIEYLDRHYPGATPLIPLDADVALEARLLDRCFDNYIHTPLQKMVRDGLRPEANRDSFGVAEARAMLDTAYAWLDSRMGGRNWAVGDTFSLADCAAAPARFYADWAYPMPERLVHLKAYRRRLLMRPSFARAVEEARPYRSYFPLGAPDRD